MKNFKPSKILMFSLSVATLMAAFLTPNVKAGSQIQYNRSVREMMARRHNASVKPSKFGFFGTASKQPAAQVSSRNIVGQRPAYTPPHTSRIITRAEYDAEVAQKAAEQQALYEKQQTSVEFFQSGRQTRKFIFPLKGLFDISDRRSQRL